METARILLRVSRKGEAAAMTSDAMFERLWDGSARMQEWTDSVSHGAITSVARNIITIHTTYFCGSVTAIRTNEGLVVVDTANEETCDKVLSLIRSWDKSPIHSIIYTHGHVDHTGGTRAIDNEADGKGLAKPVITGHRNVARRMERYKVTHGLNSFVQGQQFRKPGYTYPVGHRQPDRSYDHTLAMDTGGQAVSSCVRWAGRWAVGRSGGRECEQQQQTADGKR
jgi:hypothetical protein